MHRTGQLLAGLAALCSLLGGPLARAGEVKIIDPLTWLIDEDAFQKAKSLKALRLTAPRNGFSSACVVARVKGVATLSALTGPGGSIPAESIRIRYAVQTEVVHKKRDASEGRNKLGNTEKFNNFATYDDLYPAPAGNGPLYPVWLTVKVPENQKPGLYKATLTVDGKRVPVELRVATWLCPTPDNWVSFAGIMQSPESMAMQYKVPMWSPKHWALVEQSFAHMAGLGSNMVTLTALAKNHLGQDHAMIRFRKEGDKLVPDFRLVDEYMTRYLKHCTPPRSLILYMWDQREKGIKKVKLPSGVRREKPFTKGMAITIVDAAGRLTFGESPPFGTPESGTFWKPVVDGIRSRALKQWGCKPAALLIGMADDARPLDTQRAFARDLAPDYRWMLFTHFRGDPLPGKDGKLVLGDRIGIAPPEIRRDKVKMAAYIAERLGDVGMEVGQVDQPYVPAVQYKKWTIMGGWPDTTYTGMYTNNRGTFCQYSYPSIWRTHPWACTHYHPKSGAGLAARSTFGYSRMMLDYWDVADNKAGDDMPGHIAAGRAKRGEYSLLNKYDGTKWTNLYRIGPRFIVAAGPDGPLATVRYEMLREGAQETEARLVIERALVAKKVSAKMEKQCLALLNERIRWQEKAGTRGRSRKDKRGKAMIKRLSPADRALVGEESDRALWGHAPAPLWQDMTTRLFELAGKLGGK